MPREGERLGKIVRDVDETRDVADKELQLSHAVPKPVKPHVARLFYQGAPPPSAQGSGSLHRAGSVLCQLSASLRF